MKTILRFALLSLALVTLPASAQMDWNMVGSAGTLDPATAPGAVQYVNMTAQHAAGALGQIILRYPVTNTGLSGTTLPGWAFMEVGHVDNGPNGFVTARLFEVDRCTNVQRQIAFLNSLDGPAGPVCPAAPITVAIDFSRHIYYVEVTLNRTVVAATPSLQYVALY